jgi:ferredoxin
MTTQQEVFRFDAAPMKADRSAGWRYSDGSVADLIAAAQRATRACPEQSIRLEE